MPKIEALRIYEGPQARPKDWGFPMLFVLLRSLSRLGIGVIQPINRKGEPDGRPEQMDLQIITKYYTLMSKRETSEVLDLESREEMALTHGKGGGP